MQSEVSEEQSTLASVRRRGQNCLGYLFWVLAALCLLWALNALTSLLERWVSMLQALRRYTGLPAPVAGPDYWILGGVALLALLGVAALAFAYAAYRAAWNRRLHAVWRVPPPAHVRIRRLPASASDAELRRKSAYIQALASTSEWSGTAIVPSPDPHEHYKLSAAAMLRSIEPDIARRAVTVGLVIGLNRNPFIDTISIAAAAFELQLHVLTRLGKRPSAYTWIELIKRTGASLFLNTYITRNDALYLNLAIRKAALGLEVAADSVHEASTALADVDWDEVLGSISVPGLSTVTSFATMSLSVGAFGLRQLGSFIEATANDLLQGVLAAGILYYHGMALAADCLALDAEHRRTPEMTRTIGEAMSIACAPAGQLLRDQVRRMREFLRERRRLALTVAKDAAKGGVDKLRSASSSKWDSVKGASRLFRTRAPE